MIRQIEEAQLSLKYKPDWELPYIYLAACYWQKGAIIKDRKLEISLYEKSQECYLKALELNEDSESVKEGLGLIRILINVRSKK